MSKASIVVLNDQGGGVMDFSNSLAACLRAQEHGHPPVVCMSVCNHSSNTNDNVTETLRAECHGAIPIVCMRFPSVCFEPGIAKREGDPNRFVKDMSVTLRANMGDNQPSVCYAIDHVVTTGGNCTAQGPCYYEDICPTQKASGVHAVCYGVSRSAMKGGMNAGGMPVEEQIQPTITANGCGAICYESHLTRMPDTVGLTRESGVGRCE